MTSPQRSLVSRVVAGDVEALDAWYREQHPEVFRLCMGFLADGAEAEDTAQDAMIHLLDRLPMCDPRRDFASWRNAVVLNLCRDRRRRLVRRRAAELRAVEHRALIADRALPPPEDDLCRGEVRSILEGALASLTDREREAFVLRDLEGADTAEVARAMGVSAGSVRSLVTLARRRLRGLLATRLSGGGASRA